MSSLRVQVLVVAIALLLVLGATFLGNQRRFFLPGKTSDGHYMIELACDACHGGFESVGNEKCEACHRAELAADTHPPPMFDDPRWSADLERIDALRCVTCHHEHVVAAGGVTIPAGFCFPCHDDVVEKRPTHRALEPASCGTSGCHNYHDNTALNPAFIAEHLGEPELLDEPGPLIRRIRSAAARTVPADSPDRSSLDPVIVEAWQGSLHAQHDVNCTKCHGPGSFQAAVSEADCGDCHGFEVETFHEGKHGARQRVGLAPLRPQAARRPMQPATGRPGQLDCAACHDPHSADTRHAAVDACLRCHADLHSLSFEGSPHGATIGLRRGVGGPGSLEVTCAACHLPRRVVREGGVERVAVNHNNALTLRPPDRMVKEVCMHCHGLEFALSSILDPRLIENNFRGKPRQLLQTFDMMSSLLEESQSPAR